VAEKIAKAFATDFFVDNIITVCLNTSVGQGPVEFVTYQ
jgi:hypothetical protein